MNRTIDSILKYGIMTMVYCTLFVPLVVSGSLYFPYITGKAYLLRFLIEAGFAMYLILVIRDRSYLPKKNPLTWAILAFTIVMGMATIHAEDPMKSFWSNFERMEGYVTVLHLFAFYLMMSATFRSRRAWFWLLNTSLGFSVIVGINGFMDYSMPHNGSSIRIAGSLGNSTYLGVYALIHAFLAGLLIFTSLKAKRFSEVAGRVSAYVALIIWNVVVMYNTGTRGSFVGMLAGMLVMAFILAVFEKRRKVYRNIGIGFLVAVFLVIGLLGSLKNTSFVRNSNLLSRFSSLIRWDVASIIDTEGHSRQLLWSIASKGVAERPILGWGEDNFGYVFAKYYDPKMYDQEQWFDRTHDVFFDWLIAGGILGLLGYLSMFVAALWMVSKPPRVSVGENEWSLEEKAAIFGLFVAYFVHNIFVFDNLSSYILCFILFGYIGARYNAMAFSPASGDRALVKNPYAQAAIALLVAIVLCFVMNEVIIKPYDAGSYLITGLEDQVAVAPTDPTSLVPGGQTVRNQTSAEKLADFQAALSLNTFGNTEIRERLTDVAGSVISSEPDKSVVKQFVQLVNDQYEKQFKETPNDPRPYIFYGMYLQKLGLNDQALQFIDKAVSLSPSKQSFLFQEGSTLVADSKLDQAAAVFKSAYDLLPSDTEAQTLYALSLIYDNHTDQALKLIGTSTVITTDKRILEALAETKQYAAIVAVTKINIAASSTDAQAHVSLAAAYIKLGQRNDAIAEINEAIKLVPAFQAEGEYYIKEIEAGRDPSEEAASSTSSR